MIFMLHNPHKAPSRQVWLDEKSGKYNVYRKDVKEASTSATTLTIWKTISDEKDILPDFTGKHWKIRLPQYEHFTRLDTLNERWTPEYIQRTMGAYASFGNHHLSAANAAEFTGPV